MAIKGGGVTLVATMWSLTGLTTIFLLLRLYTRLVVLRAFGGDDHVYILAYVCLALMTSFYTKAATLGLGQSNAEIGNEDNIVEAILWEAIGQTFTVLGTAIAKWSLGLFLLRLVKVRWQVIVIWTAMSGLLAASISVLFAFWLQCRPFAYLWDRRIPGGHCVISAVPASTVLNISTVIVDILFAVLPWLFIWALKINKQEKIVILASMSLGVLAAASGIKRALEIGGLSSPDYLRDTVGLLLWSTVEQSVTMICICIPVCRPLFKIMIRRVLPKSTSDDGSGRTDKFRLNRLVHRSQPTIGSGGKRGFRPKLYDLTTAADDEVTTYTECYTKGPAPNNGSDEQVLLSNTAATPQPNGHTSLNNGIRVTDEVRVTRTGENV